jgi:hypothetical protein
VLLKNGYRQDTGRVRAASSVVQTIYTSHVYTMWVNANCTINCTQEVLCTSRTEHHFFSTDVVTFQEIPRKFQNNKASNFKCKVQNLFVICFFSTHRIIHWTLWKRLECEHLPLNNHYCWTWLNWGQSKDFSFNVKLGKQKSFSVPNKTFLW